MKDKSDKSYGIPFLLVLNATSPIDEDMTRSLVDKILTDSSHRATLIDVNDDNDNDNNVDNYN